MSEKKSSKKYLILVVFAIVVVIVLFHFNKGEQPPNSEMNADTINAENTADGDSSMEKYFEDAQKLFNAGNVKAAAEQIRKSAAALKPNVELIPEESEALQRTADDLNKLADAVENRTIQNVDRLKKSFAGVYLSLSKFHQGRAIQSWAEKNYQNAGNELNEASENLKQAAKLTGDKVESGFGRVIDKSKNLADRLLKGIGKMTDSLGDEIKNVGIEINEIGDKIESDNK